jgi:hypothetical protein
MIVNDHWTLELDDLGMERMAEELAGTALACRPPFAIGVFGKWGSGKTSLMRYAMARLGGAPLAVTLRSTPRHPLTELPPGLEERWEALRARAPEFVLDALRAQQKPGMPAPTPRDVQVLPIWFNPWLHQSQSSPLVPLLHEMAAQGTAFARAAQAAHKIGATALESAVDLLFSLAQSAVSLGGAPSGGIAEIPDRVRKHLGDYERARLQDASEVQRFNLLFEAAVARLLGEDVDRPRRAGRFGPLATRRLVVFVDDLDRCEEQQVVRLLEAIKLYLQTRNCVFVLGLDEGAVRRSIVRVWAGRSQQEAQDYLDKLFQAVIYVPAGRNYGRFIRFLLRSWGIGAGLEGCAELVEELVERNPRKVKNFINGLMLAWRASGLTAGAAAGAATDATAEAPAGPGAPDVPFVLVQYLRVYHPDVARLLQHDLGYAANLNTALSQLDLLERATAPAVEVFMARAFRHAFEAVSVGRSDGGAGVADELLARIDRHRGDRRFLQEWERRYILSPERGGMGLDPRVDLAAAVELGQVAPAQVLGG